MNIGRKLLKIYPQREFHFFKGNFPDLNQQPDCLDCHHYIQIRQLCLKATIKIEEISFKMDVSNLKTNTGKYLVYFFVFLVLFFN